MKIKVLEIRGHVHEARNLNYIDEEITYKCKLER